jgi:glutathione S-transferase
MNPEVQANVDRIERLWTQSRERFGSGGAFLCGEFCAADAMYAPVVMRFRTYAVKVSAPSQRYCDAMLAAPGLRAWIEGALEEKEFVAEDEPYAAAPLA